MEESEDQLLEQFESLISQNNSQTTENRHSKSILNLQKGIFQYNIEDKGLGIPFKVNLEQKQNKNIIFNNSHYNPINNDGIFQKLTFKRKEELKKDIEYDSSDLDFMVLKEQFDYNIIQQELQHNISNYWVDEMNIKCKNSFSTGFQFNPLTNDLIDFNNELIDPNFKNFSSEGYTGKIFQIGDKSSNVEEEDLSYKKKKFLSYDNKDQIEQDFKDLAQNIEEFCQNQSQNVQQTRKIASNKSEKVQKIIGQQRQKIYDNVSDQLNIAKCQGDSLFDSELAIKSIKSSFETEIERKNRINLVYKGKDVSEILEQANKRLSLQEEFQDLALNQQQSEESKPSVLDTDPTLFFQKTRLEESQKAEQIIKNNQWAFEDNQDCSTFYDRLPKERMAIQYPFELDNFQKRSVLRLEDGQNVFVCAHTSAGKTVIAEYSIALARRNKRKAIYTSPIKALSNQKYRDFKERFGEDVGIITGDVSLNPTASCLIVTTEVLRNMLYKGHDIVRDIAWVIFDEVHYVNNQERGVVWEETIILLPESIGLVMLSATVPNHMDFANWVGRTKQRKIYVQKTLYRPVPLEHSIYYDGKLFVIKSANDGFNQENYDKINRYIKEQESVKKSIVNNKKEMIQEKKDKEIYKNTNLSQMAKAKQKQISEKFIKKTTQNNGGKKGGPQTEAQQVKNLLKSCQKNDLLPCVVFAFSKNMIKQLSESLGNLSLVSHEEAKEIEEFFNKASHKLKPRDLEVHQIKTLKNLMMRGIAVHHSDVIPFIKEVVEILFSKGLIKVLFATETFAMGINMPTKTVIFFSVKKHDSNSLRMLNSSEYTQMSGRAGRRGLDLKGNVIILITEPRRLPTRIDLTKMLDHKGEMLQSKFKLNYELILKLLSSRELDIKEMMKKSYSANDKFSQLPVNLQKIGDVQKKLKELQQITCPYKPVTMPIIPIEDYYQLTQQLKQANQKYWSTEISYLQNEFVFPSYCEFIDDNFNPFLGLIVEFIKKSTYERFFVVMYAYQLAIEGKSIKPDFRKLGSSCFFPENNYQPFQYIFQKKDYLAEIIELPSTHLTKIFDIGFDANPSLRNKNYLNLCAKNLITKAQEYQDYRQISNGKQVKNIKDKGQFINDRFKQIQTESKPDDIAIRDSIIQGFEQSNCYNCNLRDDHFSKISTRFGLQTEFDNLMVALDEDDLAEHKNFQARLKVLRTLTYTDEEDLPQLKARLAKEIENIYVSEIIVQGVFDDLDEAEIAAILICFVTQCKKKDGEIYDPILDHEEHGFNYSPRFINAYEKARQILLSTISLEMKNEIIITESENEYLPEVFNTELLKVAYEWVKGKDFLHVTLLTDVQEGTIIRSMLRLDNLMKNVKNSAQYIGNNTLSLKIESCQEMMRRDIIFAQSLYLEEDSHF